MLGKTISHYKVLEKIGEGGIATHCAEDTRLKTAGCAWSGVSKRRKQK